MKLYQKPVFRAYATAKIIPMSLLKSSFKIGSLTLLSRLVGYVRDVMLASRLGAGALSDAFFVSFRLPNIFRSLFAEGAFNAAFVPMFAKIKEKEAAREFAEKVFAVLLAALLVFTIFAQVFMPGFMILLASGFEGEKFELAVMLTRITFPYLIFISLVSLLGGVLNSVDKFGAVAFTPVLMNLSMIFTVLVLEGYFPNEAYAFSVGVMVSGVVQFAYLYNECRKAGYRINLKMPRMNPEIRKLLKNMFPVMLGAGVLQINVLVNTQIASYISDGAVSFLYYADRVSQLPLALIGTAIGTAMLPMLSRLFRENEVKKANDTQNTAFEIAWFFSVPAAFGVLAIAGPIVSVLFERDNFSHDDAMAVTRALWAYSLGIPAFVLMKIFTPGFYSNDDTKTPVKIAVCCIAANLIISLGLIFGLGFDHVALAIATSVSSWLNVVLLAVALHKRKLFKFLDQTISRALKVLGASIAMSVIVVIFYMTLEPYIPMLVNLVFSVGLGGGAFLVITIFSNAFDKEEYLAILKRKMPSRKNKKK